MEWKRSPKLKGDAKLKPIPFRYELGHDNLDVQTPFGLDLTLGPLRIEDVPVLVYWSERQQAPRIFILSYEENDRNLTASIVAYEIILASKSIDCTLEKFARASTNNCRMDIESYGWHWDGKDAGDAIYRFWDGKLSFSALVEDCSEYGRGL